MERKTAKNDTPGFCPDCGSILPPIKSSGGLSCYVCLKEHDVSSFGDMRVEYNIHFNSVPDKIDDEESSKDKNEGPIVERKCSRCGNGTMSYATLQLRSADEGQTVFYTCTKCSFKETENS